MTPDFSEMLGESYGALARRVRAFAERDLAAFATEPEDAAGEQDRLREAVALLAREDLLVHAVGAPADAHPRDPKIEALAAATNGGGFDGTGGVRALALLRELLAYHSGLVDVALVMQGLGSFPVSLAGSDQLKRRWLPAVADGTAIAAFAATEPGAGSDLGAIALGARRDGDDYILDGVKTLISNAPIADLLTVFARTSPDGGTKGLSAFAVPGDSRGLDRSETMRTIAPHPIGTLRFSACRVPAAFRLGAEGEGARIALATLARFRPTVGAAAVGFASRAFDEARGHALGRKQFGRPLAEFQGIQAKLADMATAIAASRLLVYRAAARLDAGQRAVRETSMAKLFATEAAGAVADEAVQIFGGMGVIRGSVVERIYREVRALRIYEGTSEIQRSIIARELLEGA